MTKQQPEEFDESPEWARDTPRKRFSTPYNFSEKIKWAWHNVKPSKKYKELTDFIPQKYSLNAISPKIKLGFLGDIMRLKDKELQFAPELSEFFQDVDYLIGNFEGTILKEKKKGIMVQGHSEKILEVLETLFPPKKFVLGNANNHSGDLGWNLFNESYTMLKDHGFLTIGRRDEPCILLNNQVNVTACTDWTNQPDTPFISYMGEIDDHFSPEANFNVLFPHWGYEMQFYPNPKQIERTKTLLEKWDLIIGHHSHCPQPITAYEIETVKKLVAYSLGDFCFGIGIKKYHHGIVVKVELGPANGAWKAGEVEWKFTRVNKIDKSTQEIRLEDTCKYFKDKL